MLKKIKLYFKKIKRAKRIKRLMKKIAPYLKGDFGIELNYKMWTTKGARFSASHRNRILHSLSSKTIGYLSAYVIIINLINIYNIPFFIKLTDNELGFTTTALSIIILLYSQFESSKNYSIKTEKFHQCSLEIGELYNELRMVKTFKNITTKEQEERIKQISKRYDIVLKQHDNHLPIDRLDFIKFKPEFFDLSKFDIIFIKIEKYFRIQFKYHLLIYGPIIWFLVYQLMKKYFSEHRV